MAISEETGKGAYASWELWSRPFNWLWLSSRLDTSWSDTSSRKWTYGQRIDLDWSIIGVTDTDYVGDDSVDISHNLISLEIPSALAREDNESVLVSFRNKTKEVINASHLATILELDFSEHNADDKTVSYEERQFILRMEEGFHLLSDGHYEMPLPFKTSAHNLPDNKSLALNRPSRETPVDGTSVSKGLLCFHAGSDIEGPCRKDQRFWNVEYRGHTWYIPHHGLYHSKQTVKIRVVFDCSAKFKVHSEVGIKVSQYKLK